MPNNIKIKDLADYEGSVIYCVEQDWVVGVLFKDASEANNFISWLSEEHQIMYIHLLQDRPSKIRQLVDAFRKESVSKPQIYEAMSSGIINARFYENHHPYHFDDFKIDRESMSETVEVQETSSMAVSTKKITRINQLVFLEWVADAAGIEYTDYSLPVQYDDQQRAAAEIVIKLAEWCGYDISSEFEAVEMGLASSVLRKEKCKS